jgi:Holliday junction resolvasome RuvABC endonuclease subunit
MHTHPTILALDASSTTLGFCLYAGAVLAHGEHELAGGDIAMRCQTAYDILVLLLKRWPAVDCVAIESPVARFAGAVIPQARVSGALLLACAQQWKPIIEVSPTAAKFALAGVGKCSKDTMMSRASAYGVIGEHASDALGVALASLKQIQVVANASL